ncbi:hypothetical protein D3C75_954980 [compost metagenome]
MLIATEVRQYANRRHAQRIDGDTGQQQPRQAAVPAAADAVDQYRNQQAAKKCRQHMAVQSDERGQGQRHDDHQGDEQCAAAADPQQAGIGQGVAEQPLHHRTGNR